MLATLVNVAVSAVTKPNVVWIMADDLDNDWKDDRFVIELGR